MESERDIKRLHEQFGHPSKEKLKELLKRAGHDDEEIYQWIEKISKNCESCQRYKRRSPWPVVTMS